ncbi:nucleotide sugar dehydrogenase [Gammaproteobacteria bacterium]|nr:nucleotide sugar dehydrogenase [Gammaproteobacteria bacterium]
MNQRICIIGMGYVGLANALMLAKHNHVVLVDNDSQKVINFNKGILPINEQFSQEYFKTETLNISASSDLKASSIEIDFFILALPTNLNPVTHLYDTQIIDDVISQILACNKSAKIFIKSTINIGFTAQKREQFKTESIIFSPEFLREGSALFDNLFPSRIIVGDKTPEAKQFALLLEEGCLNNSKASMLSPEAAESIKLFSNTYLAMRVSFFNEVDTFCMEHKLDSSEVINGISADARIGAYYNNPSFGYGGYCLPKDSQHLLRTFQDKGVPQNLIQAIVSSNDTRKQYLTSKIASQNPAVVGVYSLAMKEGADNYRNSAVLEIMSNLHNQGTDIIIFDPFIDSTEILGYKVYKNFHTFAKKSQIILANRFTEELEPFADKVFTRDLFHSDV